MALNLHIPENRELKPRLTVFGVGGAGGNAVNNMIMRNLEGVEFIVANTDAQALSLNDATHKVQLGERLTEGLGAGAKPEVGAGAAEESLEEIVEYLKGAHMCFITAGMGGGTGTGAAPVIAQAARELGILTIGVVTKPFSFEGARRMKLADQGIEELQRYVDTLIVIPNQNLFLLANEKTTFSDAFGMADDVLYQGVKGVTDLMVLPGLVNLDFADIRSVMDEMGKAMMGTGEAEGDDRAMLAAERAIDNPLLDEISLRGAKGVLINITGGDDMSLFEVDEASNKIREQVDPDANIIFGATQDPEMNGRIRVSVVATGIDSQVEVEEPVRERASAPVQEAPRAVEPAAPQAPAFEAPAPVQEAPAYQETAQASLDLDDASAQAEAVNAAAQAPETYQAAHEAHAHDASLSLAETAPAVAQAESSPMDARRHEVLARLQRAVEAQPPQAPAAAPASQAPAQEEARGHRFGLDSIVRRMSGGQAVARKAADPEIASAEPKLARATTRPVETPKPAAELDEAERERVDIPAFLRRQAN